MYNVSRLGQAIDCSLPENSIWPECGGQSGGGGSNIDLNSLIQTVLNDVTQILKPGSPQIRPLYTPTSTAVGSLMGNPLLWLVGGVVVVLALRRR